MIIESRVTRVAPIQVVLISQFPISWATEIFWSKTGPLLVFYLLTDRGVEHPIPLKPMMHIQLFQYFPPISTKFINYPISAKSINFPLFLFNLCFFSHLF